MPKSLPSRPDLDHLRRQAKTLLAELRSGAPAAVASFQEHLPAASGRSAAEVAAAGFRLADAQSVVARRSGFHAWPRLARHVEQLRALEGTWSFVSLMVDGAAIPAGATSGSRILIDGDRFRTESPQAVYEGEFTIDVDAEPHRLDIDFIEGPEAGNRNRAIFRLEGDRLEICLNVRGGPHPGAFGSAPGSGHAFEVLARETKARPQGVTGGVRGKSGADTTSGGAAGDAVDAEDAEAFAGPPSQALRRLQGEWRAEEILRDGQALPAFMLKTARRVASGNRVTVTVGGGTIVDALVRLQEDVAPVGVDYLHVAGPAKGALQLGIMEWRGTSAAFCMAAPGAPRPSDFTAAAGSGRTFSLWRPLA